MSRDFNSSAQAILEFLHARLGFRQWMVTRTEGKDWIVLAAKGDSYDIDLGKVCGFNRCGWEYLIEREESR
ncbi:MAG: hypothetical protein Q8M46_04950, partial [Thiobacillus sp.]|nr:hypothetical protein [Thiobacillus sp.]